MDRILNKITTNRKKFIDWLSLGLLSGAVNIVSIFILQIYLSELGYGMKHITKLILTTVPFSLQFLWSAPFDVDYKNPITNKNINQKDILLFFCISNMILVFFLFSKNHHINLIYIFSFLINLSLSCVDIIINSYKVKELEQNEYATYNTIFINSKKIFNVFSSIIFVYISYIFSWKASFYFYSCILISILVFIKIYSTKITYKVKQLQAKPSLKASFVDLKNRHGSKLFYIISFLTLYSAADIMFHAISPSLFIHFGCSKVAVANIGKLYGLFAFSIGSLITHKILTKKNIISSIKIVCILQILFKILTLLAIKFFADKTNILTYTIVTLDEISHSLEAITMITFINTILSKKYPSTQFGILTSFTFISKLFSYKVGYIIDIAGWSSVFYICIVVYLICYLLINKINKLLTF